MKLIQVFFIWPINMVYWCHFLLNYTVLDFPDVSTLRGHVGRVTCLLYPHQLHTRYDSAQLVSGGADFSICLWDISTGTLLQKFCVQAGEISQLLVPPANSSVILPKQIFLYLLYLSNDKLMYVYSLVCSSAFAVSGKITPFPSSV